MIGIREHPENDRGGHFRAFNFGHKPLFLQTVRIFQTVQTVQTVVAFSRKSIVEHREQREHKKLFSVSFVFNCL